MKFHFDSYNDMLYKLDFKYEKNYIPESNICPVCGGTLDYIQAQNKEICDSCDYEKIEVY